MMQVRYKYPLPNDGKGYRLTEEELVKLLDEVYEKGRADERELQMIRMETVTARSIESKVNYIN